MEAKFTKGEWTIENSIIQENEHISIKTEKVNVIVCNKMALAFCGTNGNKKSLANARLIADAGTTANKCGLLPSELLDQRNDLLEALIELYDSLPDGYTSKCLPKVRTAIKKATE